MDVSHTFTETITVAPFTGRSSSGDATYGTAATQPARIERETQTIRTADGRIVEAKTTIFTSSPIGIMDRVWLPEANTATVGAAATPVAIATEKDLDGDVVMYLAFL